MERVARLTLAWLFVAAIALAAGWIAVNGSPGLALGPAPVHIPWLLFAAGFALAEVAVVHVRFGRETQSFSLSELPLVIGLFFLHPMALVASRIVGGLVALLFRPGQSWLKRMFNLCQFAFGAALAGMVFHAFAGPTIVLGPAAWWATFTAALVADVAGALLISAIVSIVAGRAARTGLGEALSLGAVAALANAGMGLIAVMILWTDVRAAWLLMLVAAIMFLSYRGYASLRRWQENLEQLYVGTLVGPRGDDPALVMEAILRHAVSMFRCARAEIVLLDEQGATCTFVDEGGEVRSAPFDSIVDAPIATGVLRGGASMLAAGSAPEAGLSSCLRARGLTDGIAVALRGDRGVTGALLIGNRTMQVQALGAEDVRLLETLANHATIALDNSRLIERLRRQAAENRHRALHDGLTGLANRTLLGTRARQAIARASGTGERVAMLVLDLDRFKEINDTLGHHTGDRILCAVAGRFLNAVGDAGMVARLGGDEFAVLVPVVGDDGVARIAESLLESLIDPVGFDDMLLDVGGSIGVAIAPDHGDDPDVLLRQADIAMYVAKEERSGWELYDRARDRNTPARLTMAGELRRAVASGELTLRYQPKVDLRTGAIVGAEALVRWQHPTRGLVRPDEFIPLAEQTGLISAVTRAVLREAIAASATWRASGFAISVAVNVSARELRDEALPGEIATLLADAGVPPSSLMLEITESSIMADPARSLAVLTELSEMGIGVSIDDFGTGYSSLSQLKRLPACELKIDKGFVIGMLDDDEDAVIVRSTIDLGRNLGKRVVAEGVESEAIMEALRALGCDLVQGYHLGRPVPLRALLGALRAQARPRARDLAAV